MRDWSFSFGSAKDPIFRIEIGPDSVNANGVIFKEDYADLYELLCHISASRFGKF